MKQTNETLTQGLTDAQASVTEAITALTSAANGLETARKALVDGYSNDSTGLVKSTGVEVNDHETVAAMVEGIDAAKAILKPFAKAAGTAQRGPQAGRPEKYQLVNKADLSPVALGDKLDGMFANKVKALRGPAYKAAITDLSTVALIDVATQTIVVDGSEMTFAAAPGKAKAA